MTLPVAVIIPTFNRVAVLQRAIDSVLAQTHAPDQICIVDDGSSDGTRALVEKSYPQLSYVYQENRGVSAARNRGVSATHAPWLAFLDSDDVWHADKLAEQFAVIERNTHADSESQQNCSLVHSDEIWIRNGRRVNQMNKHRKQGGDIFSQCLQLCAISPSAAVLKRSLFDSVGGFDESLPACEDYDLWLRICCQHLVEYVDKALLTKYGGHEDQLSRQHWGMDRFRVRALTKLLAGGNLTDKQEIITRQTLTQKCQVLISGAQKRNNLPLIAECETVLSQYGLYDS